MKRVNYNRERLLFRRQFTLGPCFLEGFPTWKRIEMKPSIRLTVHPDLPVHQVRSKNSSIVLLGYILDPYRPEDRDTDIIQRLLRHMETGGARESLIRQTYPLGGRWILVVDADQDRWLFNDPCGYRQVFHARMPSDGLWCASQPGILAEMFNLAPDPEATAFFRAFRKRDPYYWWPGDSSPYKDIRHLQPNHYLDLDTGTCDRYWPDGDIIARPLEEVVAKAAPLLQRLLESASRRFELALGITAGRDTRLLLAASKAIRHQLYYFTGIYGDLNWNSPDIRVPSRLLSRLGLPHHVIRCPSRMQKGFEEIYRRNVTTARDAYGPIAQGFYDQLPRDRVCVKGNAMGIIKSKYRSDLRARRPEADKERISPQTLAWLTKMEDAFAVEAFDRWLSGIDRTNVDVLDLFKWEDRGGNWQAMSQLEWDLVFETFVPYNCRLFLINMLSVPEPFRAGPTYILHEKLMLHLWPEVLSEPFNPLARRTVVSRARALASRVGGEVIRTIRSKNPVGGGLQRAKDLLK